jgi:hypothetical protein
MEVFVFYMQENVLYTLLVHGIVVKWLVLLLYMWEVPGSNLDPDTNTYMWYFSWLFPVLPDAYQDSTLN